MRYNRDLIIAEQKNVAELNLLQREYDAMSLLRKIKELGRAVDLSNRIARVESLMHERRLMYDFPYMTDQHELTDDTTPDTFVPNI